MITDGLDSGYRIESGTSFTGVTTFYEFINTNPKVIYPISMPKPGFSEGFQNA
jgi:hypothetical protein